MIEDISRKPKSFKDIMLASYVLGRFFNQRSEHQEPIGLMLPNSVAAICAFFGFNRKERGIFIFFSVNPFD